MTRKQESSEEEELWSFHLPWGKFISGSLNPGFYLTLYGRPEAEHEIEQRFGLMTLYTMPGSRRATVLVNEPKNPQSKPNPDLEEDSGVIVPASVLPLDEDKDNRIP